MTDFLAPAVELDASDIGESVVDAAVLWVDAACADGAAYVVVAAAAVAELDVVVPLKVDLDGVVALEILNKKVEFVDDAADRHLDDPNSQMDEEAHEGSVIYDADWVTSDWGIGSDMVMPYILVLGVGLGAGVALVGGSVANVVASVEDLAFDVLAVHTVVVDNILEVDAAAEDTENAGDTSYVEVAVVVVGVAGMV